MKRFRITVDGVATWIEECESAFLAWSKAIDMYPEAIRIVVKPVGRLRAV
jgi:hypothetical protein